MLVLPSRAEVSESVYEAKSEEYNTFLLHWAGNAGDWQRELEGIRRGPEERDGGRERKVLAFVVATSKRTIFALMCCPHFRIMI